MWEENQRDINYAEFMAYDKFEPNVKIHNNALKQAYVAYRISVIDGGSIENYMKNAKNTVEKIMSSITITNYKIQLILWTEWFINDDESDIKKAINSRMIAVYPTSENAYNELSNFILNQIEHINFPSSGFSFKRILYMDVDIHKVNLIKGSSYVELEDWIKNKRAIINPQNSDNECFKWAVIAAVYSVDHPNRVNSLRAYDNRFDWSGLTFPLEKDKIGLFENRNAYAVNVLWIDDKGKFSILRKSKKDAKQINLFYTLGHYTAIKCLSRLLSNSNSKHGHKGYYCINCLNGFLVRISISKTFSLLCR